jgi:uncharacterized protein (DUF433 family)
MNWQDFVEERPPDMREKPVFKGTRITVEHVLEELARGMSEADLLRSHPPLTLEHLQAAILFRAEHSPTRELGFLKGKIFISDDFDEPLDDFKDYT